MRKPLAVLRHSIPLLLLLLTCGAAARRPGFSSVWFTPDDFEDEPEEGMLSDAELEATRASPSGSLLQLDEGGRRKNTNLNDTNVAAIGTTSNGTDADEDCPTCLDKVNRDVDDVVEKVPDGFDVKVELIVEVTVGKLVILFLILNMMLLVLITFPVKETQRGTLSLLSLCIAIFCAVLFEHGHLNLARHIFTDYVYRNSAVSFDFKEDIGLFSKMLLIVDLPILLIWFTITSVVSYKVRRHKAKLYAIAMVFSHITAFIAMGMFKFVPEQWGKKYREEFAAKNGSDKADEALYFDAWTIQAYLVAMFLAGSFYFVGCHTKRWVSLRYVATQLAPEAGEDRCRDQAASDDKHARVAEDPEMDEENEIEEEDEWIEKVWEEEVTSSALVISYLLKNMIASTIVHSAPSRHDTYRNLLITLGCLFTCQCLMAIVRIKVLQKYLGLSSKWFEPLQNAMTYGELLMIMSQVWLANTGIRECLSDEGVYARLQYIYTALVVSPLAFAFLGLMGIVRYFMPRRRDSRGGFLGDDEERRIVYGIEFALALVMGISWEKALAESVHHVVHEATHWSRLSTEYAEALLGISIGGFTMFAWGAFLVPRLVDEYGEEFSSKHTPSKQGAESSLSSLHHFQTSKSR